MTDYDDDKRGNTGGKNLARSSDAPQICLGFETALLFWRAVHEGRLDPPEPTALTEVPEDCATSFRCLSRISLEPLGIALTPSGAVASYEERPIGWGSRKGNESVSGLVPRGLAIPPGTTADIHVLTPEASQRGKHPHVRAHLLKGGLPEGSLYRISDGLLVTSPELTFMQVCDTRRTLPNLELALELCGTYAFYPSALPCRFDIAPVTSRERLRTFLACIGRRWGTKQVAKTLQWVRDGFASPREAELFLMLVLPVEMGGYGLPAPEVNVEASREVGLAVAGLPQSARFVPDLVWTCEDRKVVLEYDGMEEHESDVRKVAADKERRSELAARGYAVIVVTKRDLTSMNALQTKVSQLMRALNRELREPSSEDARSRSRLFRWLFNPRHDHLPFGYGYN